MKKIVYKKYLELFAGVLLLFGGVGFGIMYTLPVSAAPGNVFTQTACSGNPLCQPSATSRIFGVLNTVVTVLLWASGIISVIMIIVGGIMYSVAAGDPGKITKAKDTVLYAVIGLVVSILAYTIVNFVLTKI